MAVIAAVDPLLIAAQGLVGNEFGAGHRLVVPAGWTESERLAAVADADVILTATAPVTATMLHAAPRATLVAKPGAGVDNIDLAAAARRGVVVCNAPGTRGAAVAEFVVWALLHLARRGFDPAAAVDRLGLDLSGRTLGLVGLGDIGTRVARSARSLGMEVVAATPSARNRDPLTPVRFVDLGEIHTVVDALVLCMPLTPQTYRLLDARRMTQMRPEAMLVNVARGPSVVTQDLLEVMSTGHLHGAVLDVTDPEPLPADHPLRSLPKVVVTPHLAGRTVGAQRLALRVMVDNVRAHLQGRTPPNMLTTAVQE